MRDPHFRHSAQDSDFGFRMSFGFRFSVFGFPHRISVPALQVGSLSTFIAFVGFETRMIIIPFFASGEVAL